MPGLPDFWRSLREMMASDFPGLVPRSIQIRIAENEEPIVLIVPHCLPRDPPSGTKSLSRSACRHSQDFSTAVWMGQEYVFSPAQRAVVRQLWTAWEDGVGGVGQDSLLEAADSSAERLRDLFREHPAWGTMIVPCGKGVFRLNDG